MDTLGGMRALANGLPIVCIPMGRDQNDVAARVVARGAGLRLSQKASIPALRHAIQQVLDEPGFRAQADHLAQTIAEETRRPLAADALKEPKSSRPHKSRVCAFA
jgi:UDP:flavonoid glycosyltransferase YjiC (YdhE family)